MTATSWRDTAYDDTYSRTIVSLQRRQAEDPSFTVEAARGQLKHLYVQDGNNWVGRGELQDIVMQATLDAYEHYISAREAQGRS